MRKIVYKIGRILTIKSLSGKKTFEDFLLFAVFYRNRPARLSLRNTRRNAEKRCFSFFVDYQYFAKFRLCNCLKNRLIRG
jgi:hypothetical protein